MRKGLNKSNRQERDKYGASSGQTNPSPHRNKRLRSNFRRPRNNPETKDRFYTKEHIFISRMASILQMSKEKVKSLFSQRTVSTIRLNPLAADPQRIFGRLRKEGLELETVPWSPESYIVANRDKSELGKMEEYKKGLFYIQNLSSILATLILDPQPGENILDMCAAPGSKTTHIAALMNNQGQIVANDQDFHRVQDLQRVLAEFHVRNAQPRVSDGTKLGGQMRENFDRVLLDAPCSGEGLIYLSGPKPLRFWTLKKVKAMSRLQENLIKSAYIALKKGGVMVYSTCTLEPDENEAVMEELLHTHPDAEIEKIPLISDEQFKDYKDFTVPGITKWSGNTYPPQLRNAVRVIPGKRMQGFFIARIRKP